MSPAALLVAATALLCSCNAPDTAEADATAPEAANNSDRPLASPLAKPAKDQPQSRVATQKDPAMSDAPPAKLKPATPSASPRPVVKPSPVEIPAEVDPVHPEPGDEVPR